MKTPIWLKVWLFLYNNKQTQYNFSNVIHELKISSNSFYDAVEFLIKLDFIDVKRENTQNVIVVKQVTNEEFKLLSHIFNVYNGE